MDPTDPRDGALSPGAHVGPYMVTDRIGSGGMGEVYRARDARFGRDVAIKVLPVSYASGPRAAPALRAGGAGRRGDRPSRHPRRPRLRIARRASVPRHRAPRGRKLARAPRVGRVAGAQGCGPRGSDRARPRGRARKGHRPPRSEARQRLPDQGGPSQDPRLRPREGHRGRVGQRNRDDFSQPRLASTGHTCGRPPRHGRLSVARAGPWKSCRCSERHLRPRYGLLRDGDGSPSLARGSTIETLNAILTEDVAEMTTATGPVPPPLERLCRRCLEKDPDERFQTARDLAFALEAVSTDHGSGAVGSLALQTDDRDRRNVGRLMRVLGLIGLGALLLASSCLCLFEPPPPRITGSRALLNGFGNQIYGWSSLTETGSTSRCSAMEESKAPGISSWRRTRSPDPAHETRDRLRRVEKALGSAGPGVGREVSRHLLPRCASLGDPSAGGEPNAPRCRRRMGHVVARRRDDRVLRRIG